MKATDIIVSKDMSRGSVAASGNDGDVFEDWGCDGVAVV